ncbi:MAG: 5'/3'-nucleotidase SurE [Bacteroidota bacterium]
MAEKKEKIILVTNDDGMNAKGLSALTEVCMDFGKVYVVAPEEGQSGMSHAITVKVPLRLNKVKSSENLTLYSCNGTPVDCVKLALNRVLPQKPDIIVSGINHGSNSSSSVVYSGTMAAAMEGAINQVPAAGFSLLDFSQDADFALAKKYARIIIERLLDEGLPVFTCLNVNIPVNHDREVKGIKICRQTRGFWQEEFEKRTDPHLFDYYWLTGTYKNLEPSAEDTDEWALSQNYVAVVPVKVDLTCKDTIEKIKNWEKLNLNNR